MVILVITIGLKEELIVVFSVCLSIYLFELNYYCYCGVVAVTTTNFILYRLPYRLYVLPV